MNNENQNMNNPDYNQQQYDQNVAQAPVAEKAEPSKKGNGALIAVLVLIIIGLVGYIVYTNFMQKDEPTPEPTSDLPTKSIKELVQFDNSQLTEKSDVSEDGKTYYKVLTYKNNDLTVDIKFELKAEADKSTTLVDLYVNGKFVKKMHTFEYEICDPEQFGCNTEAEAKSYPIGIVKEGLGTIKGDKYYFYIYLGNYDFTGKAIFINEFGKIVGESYKMDNYEPSSTDIKLGSDCKLYAFTKTDDHYASIFITDDAMYYAHLAKYDADYNETANEYKLTVDNDQIVVEKIGTCNVQSEGAKPFQEDYEDM